MPLLRQPFGALTADKSETAAKFIEQLLDQGDLEAAASVIGTAQPGQLLEPELAFVAGAADVASPENWTTGHG